MPPGFELWNKNFLSVVNHLLADHDDGQLLGQLNEAAAVAAVLVSEVAEYVLVVARVAHEAALKERNVEDGGVEIDKLEDEDFEGQVVVEVGLGPVHFPGGQLQGQFLVHSAQGHDEDEIDAGAAQGGDQLRHRPQRLVLEERDCHQRAVDDDGQNENENQTYLKRNLIITLPLSTS